MVKTPHWPKNTAYKNDINLGLSRVKELLARLDNAQEKLPPVIHVAGTNGKGSVVAGLKAIFEDAGLRVHVYTSPNLVRFNERIVLAGAEISDDFLYDILEECRLAAGDLPITFFEGTTIAAFLAFSRVQADVVLLETGLGGRLDATNVVDSPALTVITSLSLDHTDFLGDSIDKIAFEKAGIMKAGTPCVAMNQCAVAEDVLRARAKEVGCDIHVEGREWSFRKDEKITYKGKNISGLFNKSNLVGEHQIENSALMIACIDFLQDFEISEKNINNGLQNITHNARMQKLDNDKFALSLPESCEIWLDGGHNEAAAIAIAKTLEKWREKSLKIHLIIGILSDKDVESYLDKICKYADSIHCVKIPEEVKSLRPEEIAKIASDKGAFASVNASVLDAIKEVASEEKEKCAILICGSLYLAGSVLQEMEGSFNSLEKA